MNARELIDAETASQSELEQLADRLVPTINRMFSMPNVGRGARAIESVSGWLSNPSNLEIQNPPKIKRDGSSIVLHYYFKNPRAEYEYVNLDVRRKRVL